VLSRFGELGPLDAFAAAEANGVGAELDASVIRAASRLRDSLPPNCFLSVNVGPHHLAAPVVRAALEGYRTLQGVVVELTEHAPVADYERLAHDVAWLRERGAVLAVDDAGAGYASMRHVIALRPDFVKVDQAVVTRLDRDEAKAALVEMLGSFAGRLDAWLVAEGVEHELELVALQRLQVPLAQGFHLALPGEPWPEVTRDVARLIAERTQRAAGDTVAGLVEGAPAVRHEPQAHVLLAGDDRLDLVLLLDEWERPVGLVDRGGGVRSTLRVVPTAGIVDVARRAVTRDAPCRFDPAVVCDETGRYVGVVRLERLVERLAR
jgi:EAL domain-containing protein (putative c-di-GMP-specific phosphodiesterase class I)